MKSSTRTIMALIILITTTASFAANQNPPEPPEIKTITISGSVGLAGVEMQGLPGAPVSDSNGRYSATVESGWTGTVEPMKRGYFFRPAAITYSAVTKNRTNQDYAAEQITLTISGNISKDNKGISGVRLKGLPHNVVTDENGYYNVSVPYGWSGMIRPYKKGLLFEPPERSYHLVTRDLLSENYSVRTETCSISGEIGEAGVLLKGLPGDPYTDGDGTYSVTVPYGWSGAVTPAKKGYTFEPPYRQYNALIGNEDNQDYWPTEISMARMFEDSVSRRVLIVPTSETKIGDFEQTTEDMLVMLQIFDDKIKDTPDSIRGVFRNYGEIFGRDNKTSKAIYIQNYGILFLLEVDLPLVFPPESQPRQQEQTEQEDVDPVWQQAKEQVFSPMDDGRGTMSGSRSEDIQKRVEQLKNELIRTLKHASNIRHTEPDDWVILSVTGWSESTGRITPDNRYQMMENRTDARRRSRSTDRMGELYGGSYSRSGRESGSSSRGSRGGSSLSGMGSGSRGGGGFGGMIMGGRSMMGGMEVRGQTSISSVAVLTIRVKKSDVDDFANNEIDFDQFLQEVQIFTY